MIHDHHGRTAGRATLLVRATDEILGTHSTHVLIRVKSDLALPRIGGFLPDGSYYSYLTGGGGRWCLKVRVIEYLVDVDGQDTGEMFCLITDLLDHAACPAGQLAAAYAWRWAGSETSLKEAKSAITGAGPSAGPIFRSNSPALITREHAAWICGTGLCRALARAAARNAPRPQGPPRRTESPAPADILYRRPQRRAGQHPIRRRHREPARRHDRDPPPRHPARPRQAPHRHRPPPAPRPQNQNPPGLPQHRTSHHHPDRDRPDRPLHARCGLTVTARCHRPPIPARSRRTWTRPPARSDSRVTTMPVTLRNRHPRPSRPTPNAVTNTNHAEVHGIADWRVRAANGSAAN
jgi:hypothetical protein